MLRLIVLLFYLAFTAGQDNEPSSAPTTAPSSFPSGEPTGIPTIMPSGEPTGIPTLMPSGQPTGIPTLMPSGQPTGIPTLMPSGQPTGIPTLPTSIPSAMPSGEPTGIPTLMPSGQPTGIPTIVPSSIPSAMPSGQPTNTPIFQPTSEPSFIPTFMPTRFPTALPSKPPTTIPSSSAPTTPTSVPSSEPSSSQPTGIPSSYPSSEPSSLPTLCPTNMPTSSAPTTKPTSLPSSVPTMYPTSFEQIELDFNASVIFDGLNATLIDNDTEQVLLYAISNVTSVPVRDLKVLHLTSISSRRRRLAEGTLVEYSFNFIIEEIGYKDSDVAYTDVVSKLESATTGVSPTLVVSLNYYAKKTNIPSVVSEIALVTGVQDLTVTYAVTTIIRSAAPTSTPTNIPTSQPSIKPINTTDDGFFTQDNIIYCSGGLFLLIVCISCGYLIHARNKKIKELEAQVRSIGGNGNNNGNSNNDDGDLGFSDSAAHRISTRDIYGIQRETEDEVVEYNNPISDALNHILDGIADSGDEVDSYGIPSLFPKYASDQDLYYESGDEADVEEVDVDEQSRKSYETSDQLEVSSANPMLQIQMLNKLFDGGNCPNCNLGVHHYRGHDSHHIQGCPKCGHHYCYVCQKPYERDSDGFWHGTCSCPIFCRDGFDCGCPPCPDCHIGGPHCGHCGQMVTCEFALRGEMGVPLQVEKGLQQQKHHKHPQERDLSDGVLLPEMSIENPLLEAFSDSFHPSLSSSSDVHNMSTINPIFSGISPHVSSTEDDSKINMLNAVGNRAEARAKMRQQSEEQRGGIHSQGGVWKEKWSDRRERKYWVNIETKESTWFYPTGSGVEILISERKPARQFEGTDMARSGGFQRQQAPSYPERAPPPRPERFDLPPTLPPKPGGLEQPKQSLTEQLRGYSSEGNVQPKQSLTEQLRGYSSSVKDKHKERADKLKMLK